MKIIIIVITNGTQNSYKYNITFHFIFNVLEPGKVSNVVTRSEQTTITITWERPSFVNGPFKNYVVRFYINIRPIY